MASFIYPPTVATVDTGSLATAAKQDEQTVILQQIEDNTDGLETSLSSVDTKLTTTNSTLSSIDTSLDNIEAVDFATEAKQDSQITELQDIESDVEASNALLTTIDADTGSIATSTASIDSKTPALGQAAMASSSPVVIASDQSPVPVSGPLTDAELRATPVDVAVSSSALPTGAATEAKQDDEISELVDVNTELDAINAELVSINQELSDQTALLTTIDADTSAIAVSTASIDTKLDTTNSELSDVNSELDSQTTLLTDIESNTAVALTYLENIDNNQHLDTVDQIDTTPLLDTSSSNIPASSGNPLQIVASAASNVKKVVSVEDIGSYIGLYTGIALSEVLKCVLPLGGGEIEISIPAGTRISLRAMENTAITSGKIAINFLG